MITEIDLKLIEWASFMGAGDTNLGYPSCTVEYRMFKGTLNTRQPGAPAADPYVPESVAATELAVLALPADLRAVVKVAYLKHASRQQQAVMLSEKLHRRISRNNLTELIDRTHHRLAGMFDGARIFKL